MLLLDVTQRWSQFMKAFRHSVSGRVSSRQLDEVLHFMFLWNKQADWVVIMSTDTHHD